MGKNLRPSGVFLVWVCVRFVGNGKDRGVRYVQPKSGVGRGPVDVSSKNAAERFLFIPWSCKIDNAILMPISREE
jgi:hypothetical protein